MIKWLKRLLKPKGRKPTGRTTTAQKTSFLGLMLGTILMAWGVIDGGPMPSGFTWQMVLGAFLATLLLAISSSIFYFKDKSPVLVGEDFKASLQGTDPVSHATPVMSGVKTRNDIWLLEGFKAWKVYSEGGGRNGVAIIPHYLWFKGGLTVYVAADYEEMEFNELPPSIQEALLKVKGFNEYSTPIYWFRIPNITWKYSIELYSKEVVEESVRDLLAQNRAAFTGYNYSIRHLNSLTENFDIKRKSMRSGRVFREKNADRSEEYNE